MAYITLDEIKLTIPERTLAQLSSDVAPATSINADVIDAGIRYAGELIDGALRNRYTLPLTEVPTMISNIAVDLFKHWLYGRRPEGREDLPPAVVRGYKTALDLLDKIRDGKLSLGIADAPTLDQAEPARIRTRRSGRREFSAERLEKFR